MKDKNEFSKKNPENTPMNKKNKGLFFKYGLNIKLQVKTKKNLNMCQKKIHKVCQRGTNRLNISRTY